jgi:hypothetical protein
MRKIGRESISPDCAVDNSLIAIRQVHTQLHLLAGMDSSPTSQIQLCDVLLVEIAGVRSNLARNVKRTSGEPAFSHFGMNSIGE